MGTWSSSPASWASNAPAGPVQVPESSSVGSPGCVSPPSALSVDHSRSSAVGCPLLPGLDDLLGGREGPLEVDRADGRRRLGDELERRHHAEVASSPAAQRPVEVRLLVGAGRTDLPVRRDDLHRAHRVAGETHRPGQHADTATERQAADADGAARAARDRPARAADRVVDRCERRARTDRRDVTVEPHRRERAAVEHQGSRSPAAGPAGVAVAAGADRDRQAVVLREPQAGRHVVRVRDGQHGERLLPVVPRVLEQPHLVVRRVARPDQRTVDVASQLSPVDLRGAPSCWARWRGEDGSEEHAASAPRAPAPSTARRVQVVTGPPYEGARADGCLPGPIAAEEESPGWRPPAGRCSGGGEAARSA